MVKKLAQDVESIAAAPILEYSPLLNDEDLLEVIASGAASGALRAISQRQAVSEPVSDAIVATLDVPAVASLLVNPNAQIREETLDEIIQNAENIEEWHQPLVVRPDLSVRAAKRIACFVASSLLHTLCSRNDLDSKVIEEIQKNVRIRIQDESSLNDAPDEQEEKARLMVQEALEKERLDDDFVTQAATSGNRYLVIEALAQLVKRRPSFVVRVLASKQGKAITALAWAGGLSMRTALSLQEFANVPPEARTMARNGVDYSLSEDEMEWHLNYFSKSA